MMRFAVAGSSVVFGVTWRCRVLAAATVAGALCALTGCEVTQPQNTPVSQRLETNAATGRQYYIYVPSNYTHDRAWPVIVTCHGSHPYDVADMHIREWKMLGERYGCIVIAPELDATDGIVGDGPVLGMLADEKLILSILAELSYRYNIDRANIMITGFSGGGFPTYFVGLRHPDIFSVIAARSCNFSRINLDGWFTAESIKTPIIVYYGDHDAGPIQSQSENAIHYLRFERGMPVQTAIVPNCGHERHPEYAMKFFYDHWRTARPSMATSASSATPAETARIP
jgi:poly(3-hydroxybutyrate) depolymerase